MTKRNYSAYTVRTDYTKEMAVRILLAEAARYDHVNLDAINYKSLFTGKFVFILCGGKGREKVCFFNF